jgi:hypothetical protein
VENDRVWKLGSNDPEAIDDTLQPIGAIYMKWFFTSCFGKGEKKTRNARTMISMEMR